MKNKIDSMKFRFALNCLGFTIQDLAKKIGISPQSLNYKVNNQVRFNIDDIEAICKVTGETYESLFSRNIINNKK